MARTVQFNNLQLYPWKTTCCSCPSLSKRIRSNVFQLHFVIHLTYNGQHSLLSLEREFHFNSNISSDLPGLQHTFFLFRTFHLNLYYRSVTGLCQLSCRGFSDYQRKKAATQMSSRDAHHSYKTAHSSSLHFDSRDSAERCSFHATRPVHLGSLLRHPHN